MNGHPTEDVIIDYTNHRGERSERKVQPWKIEFKSTDFHPVAQWIMCAWCYERKAIRRFAMKDIHSWRTA